MRHAISQLNIDHAIKLLDSGMTLKEASKIVGFHPDNLSKRLMAFGIDTDRRAGRPSHNRLNFDPKPIVKAYESGESELSISKRLGIERVVIHRRLIEAGVHIRSGSEANFLRFQRSTEAERKAITLAARRAAFKAGVYDRLPSFAAQKKVKRIGAGEKEMLEKLRERGLAPIAQRPEGFYNIDICVGSVAVEVASYPLVGFMLKKMGSRIKYLSGKGYTVIYVCFKRLNQLLAQIDEVVSLIEESYRLPAKARKHLMIRCGSNRFTRVKNDRGQFSCIPTAEEFFNSISEIDL